MQYEIRMLFRIDEKDVAQADKLKDAILPFAKYMKNTNIDLPNKEKSFIEVRETNHDDPTRTIPDVILARFETDTGWVF